VSANLVQPIQDIAAITATGGRSSRSIKPAASHRSLSLAHKAARLHTNSRRNTYYHDGFCNLILRPCSLLIAECPHSKLKMVKRSPRSNKKNEVSQSGLHMQFSMSTTMAASQLNRCCFSGRHPEPGQACRTSVDSKWRLQQLLPTTAAATKANTAEAAASADTASSPYPTASCYMGVAWMSKHLLTPLPLLLTKERLLMPPTRGTTIIVCSLANATT